MLWQVLSTDDDPTLPVFTFRTIFLGVGLGAFGSVRLIFEQNVLSSTFLFLGVRDDLYIQASGAWLVRNSEVRDLLDCLIECQRVSTLRAHHCLCHWNCNAQWVHLGPIIID